MADQCIMCVHKQREQEIADTVLTEAQTKELNDLKAETRAAYEAKTDFTGSVQQRWYARYCALATELGLSHEES
ncbi:MAG TPA: hypothetical protein VNO32_43310, partial [Candidatus Acidoferrum sp.]|nr:hypothetical protein [Candidatus Acidoferrum sp.]